MMRYKDANKQFFFARKRGELYAIKRNQSLKVQISWRGFPLLLNPL